MVTTHQIRNVLRVYGDQLKRRNNLVQQNLEPNRQYADRVDISSEARRRQALNRMSQQVISRIPLQVNSGKYAVTENEGSLAGHDEAE